LVEFINGTLEGCGSLSLLHILFAIPIVGLMCHELFSISIIKSERKDDDFREFGVILLNSNEKSVLHLGLTVHFSIWLLAGGRTVTFMNLM
jgi:hypothetical protein